MMAQKMKALRYEQGALEFETIEAIPIFDGDTLSEMKVEQKNRAKDLIEDFMIAANGTTARYLTGKNFPSLRRVVRTFQSIGTELLNWLPNMDFHYPQRLTPNRFPSILSLSSKKTRCISLICQLVYLNF
jgi:exoribonuclease R